MSVSLIKYLYRIECSKVCCMVISQLGAIYARNLVKYQTLTQPLFPLLSWCLFVNVSTRAVVICFSLVLPSSLIFRPPHTRTYVDILSNIPSYTCAFPYNASIMYLSELYLDELFSPPFVLSLFRAVKKFIIFRNRDEKRHTLISSCLNPLPNKYFPSRYGVSNKECKCLLKYFATY